MRQTVHYLRDIGEVSCVERPVSRKRDSIFWDVEITIPDLNLRWQRKKVYVQELDDIVLDMLIKILNGNLENCRVYEFWEN